MVTSAVWHIFSALVITPALLAINKFSNRGGNKRVKILQNLLFWLLVNSCIQATQKTAIVAGVFEADRSRTEEAPRPSPPAQTSPLSPAADLHQNDSNNSRPTTSASAPTSLVKRRSAQQTDDELFKQLSEDLQAVIVDGPTGDDRDGNIGSSRTGDRSEPGSRPSSGRCKREARHPTDKHQRSAVIIFCCWFLVVALRTVSSSIQPPAPPPPRDHKPLDSL